MHREKRRFPSRETGLRGEARLGILMPLTVYLKLDPLMLLVIILLLQVLSMAGPARSPWTLAVTFPLSDLMSCVKLARS